jgi:hypothetical protein
VQHDSSGGASDDVVRRLHIHITEARTARSVDAWRGEANRRVYTTARRRSAAHVQQ